MRLIKKYWYVIVLILIVAFWSKIKELPPVKSLLEKMGIGEPPTTQTAEQIAAAAVSAADTEL